MNRGQQPWTGVVDRAQVELRAKLCADGVLGYRFLYPARSADGLFAATDCRSGGKVVATVLVGFGECVRRIAAFLHSKAPGNGHAPPTPEDFDIMIDPAAYSRLAKMASRKAGEFYDILTEAEGGIAAGSSGTYCLGGIGSLTVVLATGEVAELLSKFTQQHPPAAPDFDPRMN